MKYLTLPQHLLEFWYLESVVFFVQTWKNMISFLEEDLAVGLMWKLLFAPLFHDDSIVGRGLSFIFRLARILIGLFAFAITTVIFLIAGGYFLALPVAAILDKPLFFSRLLFLAGLGLFFIHIVGHPHKKIWRIKKAADIWDASTIKKENVNFRKLLASREVETLLSNLEIQLNGFPSFEISDIDEVAKKAFELGKVCESEYLGPHHFFVATISMMPKIDLILLKFELTVDDFTEALMYQEKKKNIWRRVYIWDDDFTVRHLKGINRGWLGVPTPNLDLVSEDLTKTAVSRGFADLIREAETLKDVVNILSQTSARNVILAGPPGVGKTAMLRHLAKKIVTGDAPAALATKRIALLDLTKLLSGIKTQGDLAERVKIIFEEIGFAQNVIIAIEEIHELGMGEAGASLNLYSLMEPYFESDTFQFIGTTEAENYSRILEKNGSFARLFRKVELMSATTKDTLAILEDRAIEAERRDKVKVTFIAIKTTVLLAQKLIHDRVLPDSAIAVLKEALTQAVNKWVTKDVIRRVISNRIKVPLMEVGTADKNEASFLLRNKLLNLEQEIHLRLIDQEQAVKAVSDALRRSVTGLREEARPIGSFLFVGPTGVGKTELARILAEVYFGGAADKSRSLSEAKGSYFKTAGAYVRFDMSEYQNPESVSRLIGSSAEAGQLTEVVRSRPYALLLLDEFEKADPKILTLFLQVLEDGRLTDGAGRTVNFENTIIIATSNAGSLTIAQELQQGQTLEVIDKQVNDELLKIFKPELVNRFDEVVIFKPLSLADLEKIVRIKLLRLQNQMKEKGYAVEFDEALVGEFAKRGFDPVLGARPLRRLIQDTLEAKLSRLILENKLIKGQAFKAGIELLSA